MFFWFSSHILLSIFATKQKKLKTSPSPYIFKVAVSLWLLVLWLMPNLILGQCGPLTTIYTGDNQQDGIMFDITATNSVVIAGFDCNLGNTVTPYNMEIYYKSGTHDGFTNNAAAWTLAGSASGFMGLGLGVPTSIPIVVNLAIPQGQTYAFYITGTGNNAYVTYSGNLPTPLGNQSASDANITIWEGTSKAYPFGAEDAARNPNITCHYYFEQPVLVETDNSCGGIADGIVEATGMGLGPWVYTISDINGVLATSLATNGPYTFTGLIEGEYTISATDASGCTGIALAELESAASMSITPVISDNLCFGGAIGSAEITISGGIAPYDITWIDPFANVLQIDPLSNGTATLDSLAAGIYIITAVGQGGCSVTSSVTVTEPATALTLTLTPQDISCFQSLDGEIAVSQDGVSPYAYEVVDVLGDPVSTASNAAAHTFQGLEAGIYFVTVIDADGCETTDNVEIFEPTQIEVQISSIPILCFNATDGVAHINQVSGGTTPYAQTLWNDPALQTGNTAINLSPGSYTASVVDANGCVLSVGFVFPNPPAMILNASYLTDTCGQGKGAAIVQAALGTPPYTYLWKPDGVDLSVHHDLYEGSYEVVVTDVNGCKDSVFVDVVDDIPYPTAAFEHRIEGEDFFDKEVQFINYSIGTSQWTWNFGDGGSASGENPRHHYEESGEYLVQLLASNGYCVDTGYQYVTIDPMHVVYVPNSFTPGINGKNDYFYPQGEGIELESYDMFIYDRWGKMVWQTGSMIKMWDGTNMNSLKPVPGGTYVYKISYRESADLNAHVIRGVVHIIYD